MLSKKEKHELEYALKLAKAVRIIVDALNTHFIEWKSTKFVDNRIIKNMEKTHQLVLDYIWGLLSGEMDALAKQIVKGQ